MLTISIPPLPDATPPKKEPAYYKHGDVSVHTCGPKLCVKVEGISYVNASPSCKTGASGTGGAYTYLPLIDAEKLLESLAATIDKLKERV